MPTLRIQQLRYGDSATINLQIQSGECIGISGPSGCGKTRLLRAIADLDPHQGQIFLDQIESQQLTPPQWRVRIGYLPSESQWWHPTALEHFKQPPDESQRQQLNLSSAILQRHTSKLSSGEKQRLALLRLLSFQPQALLLDEPTSRLDSDNCRQLEQLVASYQQQQQTAVIWISHDPAQLQRVANRQFHLSADGLMERMP